MYPFRPREVRYALKACQVHCQGELTQLCACARLFVTTTPKDFWLSEQQALFPLYLKMLG